MAQSVKSVYGRYIAHGTPADDLKDTLLSSSSVANDRFGSMIVRFANESSTKGNDRFSKTVVPSCHAPATVVSAFSCVELIAVHQTMVVKQKGKLQSNKSISSSPRESNADEMSLDASFSSQASATSQKSSASKGKAAKVVKATKVSKYASKYVGSILDEAMDSEVQRAKYPKEVKQWLGKLKVKILRQVSANSNIHFRDESKSKLCILPYFIEVFQMLCVNRRVC
jgi:hypothetical protein